MDKVPVRVDERFRLGDVLGSGSYAVVYRAQNIIKDDAVAIKLKPISNSSSIQHEYKILKHIEGGVGIPRVLWFGRESTYHTLVLDLLGPSLYSLFLTHNQKFSLDIIVNLGDQLLSHLKYIHGDIKPQNVVVGLGDLRDTAFIIDFGIAKEFCQCLTGTSAFASINNHLGVEPGHRDNLESLTYMLIYFLQGSLPWLTSDEEKLSSSLILECKVNTTIEDLCCGIPVKFATIFIYTRSLAFSENLNYNHLHSLLHVLTVCLLDFNQPDVPLIYSPPLSNEPWVIEAVPPCPPLCRSTRV
ncbi:casein kinase I isoform epsilon [Suillus discolor]|uniref:non-specific serine/threonine protein kinase n=1 Tax=Suillus discolor TaxID=1912936 RepID=A0A9P7ET21_9AGAM|nr:casein kinase I isoform epsilon [Suillus discolor]KAG2089139.1 casein kinase I isoform epsilon [Suillus discolor]